MSGDEDAIDLVASVGELDPVVVALREFLHHANAVRAVAIVQRAGRMLGHAIGLDSAPGRGSTFSVAAPVAAVGLRSPRPAVVAQRRGLGARAVLVIDNEATILDGMRAVLEGRPSKGPPCSTAVASGA